MSAPTCLSIQSAVVAGHVGHGASSFALGAEGVEVWPLPTVILSGHARTPGVKGRRAAGAEIAALGEGLAAGGALSRCDGLLTGYLGTVEAAEAVADLAVALRAARPGALFLCDPVLGDEGPGLYLPAEIGAVYRDRLLPLPAFLREGGAGDWPQVIAGLRLTGHFLTRDLLSGRAAEALGARERLLDRLNRAVA